MEAWSKRKTAYIETPEWRQNHKTTYLLKRIPDFINILKTFTNNSSNAMLVENFTKRYRITYLTECNIGENTGTVVENETEIAINSSESLTRQHLKTRNLNNALNLVFGNSLLINGLKHKFDTNLAKKINKLVGENLFNSGIYRTRDARPCGRYDYFYDSPEIIEYKMENLFTDFLDINKTIKNNAMWYSIAADFFTRFLKIHPFVNGNGRTARILVSYLLNSYLSIPIFLISPMCESKSNEIYLQSIEMASPNDEYYSDYRLLNTLIIESCYNSLFKCVSELHLL